MLKYWGILPAAGIGLRMQSELPKQYMLLRGKSVLEWTVEALGELSKLEGIYIGLNANAQRRKWAKLLHPKVLDVFQGGSSRSETVFNGIEFMRAKGHSMSDWIMVHDANRPLIKLEDLHALIEAVGDHDHGGILCQPINDTVKRGINHRIKQTLPRKEIFSAQTPQLFKAGLLREALLHCKEAGIAVTDESQAMEEIGYQPKLVVGSPTNIKLTVPADLDFARAVLNQK